MNHKQLVAAIAGSVFTATFVAAAFVTVLATYYLDDDFEKSPTIYQYDYMPTEYLPIEENFYL